MTYTDFWVVLKAAQEYIAENYSTVLSDRRRLSQLKSYLDKYVRDKSFAVEGISHETLINLLYREMAQYSILTPHLKNDELEEININAWNDIALTHHDGSIVKTREHFHSPQHAVDVIKRLLEHSHMVIDNATPMAQGHLPNNTRITVLQDPIVDTECGISASIRILHHTKINREQLVESDFAAEEMIDFLCLCLRYGISFVIAGATSSGKTTLINALLATIPDNKRIFTIESGSRELSLVRQDEEGHVANNVVHTLSRPSKNTEYNISQEDLVVASLRYNPDIICVGEMRDTEAYSAVEASLTGHTVVSTIHAYAEDAAHMRLALLCQKRFPINFQTSLMQAGQAFPLVIYTHKLENHSRKIMDITECEVTNTGECIYHTLYRYDILKNTMLGKECIIEGEFVKVNNMSEAMKRRLMQFGAPKEELERFIQREGLPQSISKRSETI